MTKKLTISLAIAVATATVLCPRVNADTCTFNNENPMSCTVLSSHDRGKAQITITWDDGVSDTYTNVGSNADRVNHLDSSGGRWHYNDHRNCRDWDLINVDNGNIIRFVGDKAACS